jgi:hypothetical protein
MIGSIDCRRGCVPAAACWQGEFEFFDGLLIVTIAR